ncbi:integrator complex subunit 14 [Schistocerca cancellata]|uniref:integrator complex subunit 14 n=1 Tax=Schistocerca cancellata TaxID=274614 RepID=UPI002117E028|nr:integrator complex subunit 14 [Schistocerca cancellata]XP_049787031.1 integrator complex subunit 14 [Schistocerca cancellata]XP_049787032.1 integrator complex subunit 14 [Schistocerca cancellata]XP_049787033.1 integrator complex subunit 14 [Schistocerca cancellata]XP_049787034.1 integrator complex subunit 14 [Schistocerca cancellata]
MPTVIVVDVSLSMTRPVALPESGEVYTRHNLAIHGINTLLDYLAVHSKLEFVALIAFSSLYEIVSPFTRDFDTIKSKLQQLEEFDKTCVETALHGVNRLILSEWGSATPCQVVLVTDGSPGVGPLSLKHSLSTLGQRDFATPFPLPFSFPCKLSVMCIAPPDDPSLQLGLPLYSRLVELAGLDSCVHVPEAALTISSVQAMFQKLAEANFASFQGTLKCGNLGSRIILSPAPQPFNKATDFEYIKRNISDTIEVCGFIDVADVGSPMAISRHLVLPHGSGKMEEADGISTVMKSEGDSDDDSGVDEGKVASFCVLLHGALKVENMAALCLLAKDWFGFVYSWADSKKKSNLMLTVLEPGTNVVPWLGNLNNLGSLEDFRAVNGEEDPPPQFPVRPLEKRSYSQNCVVWIRQAGLQSDIQKILRHARKLPDKTQQFYKELNRLKRAAISFGFIELLDGLAAIFERECTLLPGGAHPDCALQLTHAAGVLRRPYCRDIKFNVTPLLTKFQICE